MNVLQGSSYSRCEQSSYPSFFLLYVGYSSPPWLYVTLLHFSHDRSKWSSPSFSNTTFTNFQVFLIHFRKCPVFSTIQTYAPVLYLISFLIKFKSSLLVKRVLFLLNAAFATASLDLISRVHIAAFVIILPKYVKCSTFSSSFWYSNLYWGW